MYWNEWSVWSSNQYLKIRFKTPMPRSDLCDYSNLCIDFNSKIELLAADVSEKDKVGEDVVFKNNAPYPPGISNINDINRQGRKSWYSYSNVKPVGI